MVKSTSSGLIGARKHLRSSRWLPVDARTLCRLLQWNPLSACWRTCRRSSNDMCRHPISQSLRLILFYPRMRDGDTSDWFRYERVAFPLVITSLFLRQRIVSTSCSPYTCFEYCQTQIQVNHSITFFVCYSSYLRLNAILISHILNHLFVVLLRTEVHSLRMSK